MIGQLITMVFLFICKTKKDFVEINEWAKYDLVNKKYTRIVRVGPILRMLEDEIALEAGDKKSFSSSPGNCRSQSR